MVNKKICAALAATLLLSASLTGCGAKKVNVTEYIQPDIRGYEGAGHALFYVDYDRIIDENAKAFGINKLDTAKVNAVKSDLKKCLTISTDKTENLSNGDVVQISWSMENADDFKKKHKVVFTFKDTAQTIEGLQECVTLDPFSYIDTVNVYGEKPEYSLIGYDYDNDPYTIAVHSYLTMDYADENGNVLDNKPTIPPGINPHFVFTLVVNHNSQMMLHNNSGILLSRTSQKYELKDGKFEPID